MVRFLLLLPLIGLSACVVATSRSNVVVVTDAAKVVEGCTRIGTADGVSPLRQVLLRDQARDSALARLKAAAAEMGGTHVQSSVADLKWKGPDTSGTVFRCERR